MPNKGGTRRGFGAVRKLPSGRFQASYIGPDLQRHNAPTTFETKGDAEGWLASERRLRDRDDWTPPSVRANRPRKGDPTLAEWWPEFIERRRVDGEPLRPTTRAWYDQLFRHYLKPTLGGVPLKGITAARVKAWWDDFPTDRGSSVRPNAYMALRAAMSQALEEGLIIANPCTIKVQRKKKRELEVATREQVATIHSHMPEAFAPIVTIAAWCGLRFGEIIELRRGDIDPERRTIRVERAVSRVHGEFIVGPPKSDAGIRTVSMPSAVADELERHLERHVQPEPDALVFEYCGHHLQQPQFSIWWRYARGMAGRPDLRLHDLRHTSAVWYAQQGATLADLMARLGHSSPTMALHYQHAAAERDRDLTDRMAAPPVQEVSPEAVTPANTSEPDRGSELLAALTALQKLTPEQRAALQTLLKETS